MSEALLIIGGTLALGLGFLLAICLLVFVTTRWPRWLKIPARFWPWLFNEKEDA